MFQYGGKSRFVFTVRDLKHGAVPCHNWQGGLRHTRQGGLALEWLHTAKSFLNLV